MDEWKKVKLGDICQTNLETYSLSEKWDFVNYLDTGSLTKNVVSEYQEIDLQNDKLPSRARRKISVNDILYSTVRPNQEHYGIVKEVVPNMLVSTGFTVISVNQELADSDFIYYCLTQREVIEHLQAIGEQSTSAYPSIKPTDIENLELFLPSLNEQREIVSVLRVLDDKIENNRKINHHLEQIGTTIWQEKFSDKIPNGTLGDIAIISSGKRPPVKTTVQTDEEKIPILGASSVMGYTNQALYHQKILVTGRVGTHGIIQRYQRSCWPSDNTLVLQSNSYEFVYQILKNIDFTVMNRGSTQPLITQTDLKKSNIYIPTTNELSDFEIIVGTLMKQHEQNNIENDILSTLRDTLLPKLLFGKISVNQAIK